MKSILLALSVIGFIFLYTKLETINRSNIATPLIEHKKKDIPTNQVAYAPDSYLTAIGTPHGELILSSKEFTNNHYSLQKKGDKIIHLAFSQDENWLLVTDVKDKVYLWNMNSLHLVRTFEHLKRQGYQKTFSDFIEIDTFSENLIFMDNNGKHVYYHYDTEMLSYKLLVPIATY